ncbi:Uu.00g061280.m01.CDS01 [Anthostomella pinea]|uniref:Uu.00g061280.m01.CDS01 n=1 Tax=Anthostomella pinea TaxID=933095 RepID=A0AAI8VT84_9PEZI|nr:Uu.00g061280.m01.CDS01 [Anthostomella pinea]
MDNVPRQVFRFLRNSTPPSIFGSGPNNNSRSNSIGDTRKAGSGGGLDGTPKVINIVQLGEIVALVVKHLAREERASGRTAQSDWTVGYSIVDMAEHVASIRAAPGSAQRLLVEGIRSRDRVAS